MGIIIKSEKMLKVQSLKVYVLLERMATETDSNMGKENVDMPASTFSSYPDTPKLFLFLKAISQMLLILSTQQPLSLHYLYSHTAFSYTIHTLFHIQLLYHLLLITAVIFRQMHQRQINQTGKKEEITCFLENKDTTKK